MSSNKCARCEQTVYPVEGLRCLDKLWHKGCFKCHECNMTLNMKNYKGFEKRPYCNAHCPQAKATTVADTPESRRLAENTRIQSQAKYHEDFEKSKGKNFTTIADDPETRRIKETSKIISNVAYHGEIERKKQMEERRGISGPDSVPLAKINSNSMFNNNNNDKDQNNHHHLHHSIPQNYDSDSNHRSGEMYPSSQNYQDNQQQRQAQKQQLLRKQQQQQMQLLKQQQAHAQDQYDAQQQMVGHPPQNMKELVHQQHLGHKHQPTQQQQYSMSQQQQQQMMRQQQQQQHILMQQQFQRQSLDNSPMMQVNNRQIPKQANNPQQLINKNNHPRQQQNIPQQQQQQTKYIPVNEVMQPNHQAYPPHLIGSGGSPVVVAPNNHLGGPIHNNQRLIPNHPASIVGGGANQHHLMQHHVYNNQMGGGPMNGVNMPNKQQQPQQFVAMPNPPQHRQMLIHPSQMQPMNQQQQMRPIMALHPQQRGVMQPQLAFSQQPPRIFRAMYDYVANDVDEVSFFENDVLVDCVNVDRNWLIGKVARSGQTGMLPANYVTELPTQ